MTLRKAYALVVRRQRDEVVLVTGQMNHRVRLSTNFGAAAVGQAR